jgi:hypothetical protein
MATTKKVVKFIGKMIFFYFFILGVQWVGDFLFIYFFSIFEGAMAPPMVNVAPPLVFIKIVNGR